MSFNDAAMPQPASAAMDEATACWYVRYSGGQLRAFVHPDGNWYLCQPDPVPAGAPPIGVPDTLVGAAP